MRKQVIGKPTAKPALPKPTTPPKATTTHTTTTPTTTLPSSQSPLGSTPASAKARPLPTPPTIQPNPDASKLLGSPSTLPTTPSKTPPAVPSREGHGATTTPQEQMSTGGSPHHLTSFLEQKRQDQATSPLASDTQPKPPARPPRKDATPSTSTSDTQPKPPTRPPRKDLTPSTSTSDTQPKPPARPPRKDLTPSTSTSDTQPKPPARPPRKEATIPTQPTPMQPSSTTNSIPTETHPTLPSQPTGARPTPPPRPLATSSIPSPHPVTAPPITTTHSVAASSVPTTGPMATQQVSSAPQKPAPSVPPRQDLETIVGEVAAGKHTTFEAIYDRYNQAHNPFHTNSPERYKQQVTSLENPGGASVYHPSDHKKNGGGHTQYTLAGASIVDKTKERVYVHAKADHAPEIMQHILKEQMNGQNTGITAAKVWNHGEIVKRNDGIVVYTEGGKSTQDVVQSLKSYQTAHPTHFGSTTPMMTHKHGSGISTGADPVNPYEQGSFGEVRAHAIHQASQSPDVRVGGQIDPVKLQQKTDAFLRAEGIDPSDPSRNLG